MSTKNYPRYFLIFSLLTSFLFSAHATYAATKIMPLGDSITGSPGCWRAYLWEKLQAAGYTNLDFVGTLGPQGCPVAYDGDNEGHGGILATNMANQNQLPAWLAATNPDIVLMHLGTNDVWSSRPTATILAAFTTLVQQMRATNPKVKIIVAQIIPMDSASSCSTCGDGVIALNNALPTWAAGLATTASPISVVDLWTGFSATADTYDGVHPTNDGFQKMAVKWYPAVVNALGVAATSSSSSTSSKSSSSSALKFSSSSLSVSSMSSSSISSLASSSSANQQCNWYGTLYPLCATTSSGWGYENNKSCIARSTCAAQPAPYGVVGSAASSSVLSSSASSVASSSSIKSSSSTAVVSSSSKSSSSVAISSSSSKSSVASSSSSVAAIGLSCTYVVTNSWGTGYTGAIRITNNGTNAISSWSASWQFAGANRITSSWNATLTGANPYSATNLNWNGNLAAGQTIEFGFQGNTNGGSVEIPAVICK